MALAGELPRPAAADHAALTRLANRVIRIGHRLVGFGVSPGGTGGLALDRPPALHDAPAWAEMAAELRLREIARQATRP